MTDRRARRREVAARVRAVQEILRRWDPIGVAPGEFAPADEYDGYAPQIVSMVARGGSVEALSEHLQRLRTDAIGVEADSDRDAEVAEEIVAALRG